jgi:hypothetical protein
MYEYRVLQVADAPNATGLPSSGFVAVFMLQLLRIIFSVLAYQDSLFTGGSQVSIDITDFQFESEPPQKNFDLHYPRPDPESNGNQQNGNMIHKWE